MQVFVFGAARTKSTLSSDDAQLVLEKLIKGQRVLDWTLHGLHKSGISDNQIHFVGGYQVERIINQYPELHYTINPKWQETHVIGSLRYAMESWKGGDILLTYADTIFRPVVFKELLEQTAQVTIGLDRHWKDRIKNNQLLNQAEKVITDNGLVKQIGRESISPEQADGQFSGLTLIKKEVAKKINNFFFKEDSDKNQLSDQDSLTHLLRHIQIQWNIPIGIHDHSGLWAELDTRADLAKFVFGTKAETLSRIKPFVQKAKICDQIHFTINEWENSSSQILQNIQSKFSEQSLIVRSSSLEEDSWDTSQAGAFLSVANIDASNKNELQDAIEEVIAGFRQNGSGQYNENNQVLVQPFIDNVAMSGVAFSKHLEKGTPYYLVNYDDVSKRTDTITSGSSSESKSITVYKKGKTLPEDDRVTKVIEAIDELETITGYSSLDIEFVLTEDNKLYVVQVRPITTHTGMSDINDFHRRIDEAKDKITSRLKPYAHLYGETTVLADMPDWNPAEMIGVRPNPLAVSLYQYLITDSAWREARGAMGYHNPSPEKLLYCIGGHPYIDVRNSFNNLIPKGLSSELADKLVNHYISRLQENPHLHDKIEFQIAVTCYTPDIHDHCNRLRDNGFSEDEINELKEKLRILTEDAITGKHLPIEQLISKTESLNPRREKLLDTDFNKQEIPSVISLLLGDCIEKGTEPFSILARYGFIASSMLRGFVSKGIISEDQKEKFLNSIETVAGKLVEDMNGVLSGSYNKEDFLDKYGHLRPGSYDITSYSYGEKPEHYFPSETVKKGKTVNDKTSPTDSFFFDENTVQAIEKEIEAMGMSFTADQLFCFIREATAGREYAKFQFTKNLSAVLKLITQWGNSYGFLREDLSHLFIEDILMLNKFTIAQEPILYIKQKIQEGKRWHEESNKIETPQLITSTADIDVIEHNKAEPNYVTSELITAPICNLHEITDKSELEGKIVLTEGADPGYDWIFLHPIKGLITKYGGAASHMTIRCAEFGLPAAIGCGEEWYSRLKNAHKVELNCNNKQLRVLG